VELEEPKVGGGGQGGQVAWRGKSDSKSDPTFFFLTI